MCCRKAIILVKNDAAIFTAYTYLLEFKKNYETQQRFIQKQLNDCLAELEKFNDEIFEHIVERCNELEILPEDFSIEKYSCYIMNGVLFMEKKTQQES